MTCEIEQGEHISSMFLKERYDIPRCLLMNLKGLKKHLEYKHFKMQIQLVLSLTQRDFYITID